MRLKADLMTKEDMNRALKRMSHQVLECNQGADNIVILGIKRRGLPLAEALSSNIKAIEGVDVPVGELDISLYRDDAPRNLDDPVVTDCHITFAITGKDVILVDDVLYTCLLYTSSMSPIIVKDVKILGKVKGVFRYFN